MLLEVLWKEKCRREEGAEGTEKRCGSYALREVEVPQDKVGQRAYRCRGGQWATGPMTERKLGGGWEGANSTKWVAKVGRESMEDRGCERVCRK